jgi:hypothetical protein
MKVSPSLNVPQSMFLNMPQKFTAFVAGFGSGKTWVGSSCLAKHFYNFPRINAGYFAPTYRDIEDVFFPTVEEVFRDWGLNIRILQRAKEVIVSRGRTYLGVIKCRSMDDPSSIVGFKIGRALVDEIDVMDPKKAKTAWNKIIARMRYKEPGLPNGVDVTTTPEGFRFVYDRFKKKVRENPALAGLYGLVQASTYDNEANLPEDYIPSLLESYPANLIKAYIEGEFVNLQTGSIYTAYDRAANNCTDHVEDGEPVHLGMDFNVGHMASVVFVKRDGLPRAVGEIVEGYDTPDMIRQVKERFWKFEGGDYKHSRQIRVYPDASGDSRKSVNASKTDLALLKDAGFIVCAPDANPPVKDRINALNAMLCNAQGDRRLLVNADLCPTFADALEQQPWAANGEPDKTTGHDHVNDAGGYFIHREYPIVKNKTTILRRTH